MTDKHTQLKPCPWCRGGDTSLFENGKTWTGQRYSEPSSVSVRHHCEPTPGQPSRMIERVGRDEASAIAAWNTRAPDDEKAELLAALEDSLWISIGVSCQAPLIQRCRCQKCVRLRARAAIARVKAGGSPQ